MNPYRVMATMVVLLVVAEASSAQFTATADIVHLDVVVTGPNQWFVPMLSADDFEVFEDGARHKIAFFSSDEVAPLTLVILLDASSSIKHSEKGIKEAASNVVRAMSTRDKTAVVIFNDEIQQSTYFTAFQEPLLDAIRELYPEGWTALYDAILHSLEKLAGIAGRKALLVFTDGSDSRPAAAGSKASMEEVIEAGKLSEVTIYTVGFVAESRGVNENFLSTRAHGTGGRAFFPVNVEHLERSFAAIEEELHTQYRIGYAPENEAHDGAWRRIEVRIRGREELVVRTRQGYYALPRTWR